MEIGQRKIISFYYLGQESEGWERLSRLTHIRKDREIVWIYPSNKVNRCIVTITDKCISLYMLYLLITDKEKN